MAERKKTSNSKKSSPKQLELSENAKVRRNIKELKKKRDRSGTLLYSIMPGILIFAALFFLTCFIIPESMGFLKYLVVALKFLFGNAIWVIPVCLGAEAFFWKQDYMDFAVSKKSIICSSFLACVNILLQLRLG